MCIWSRLTESIQSVRATFCNEYVDTYISNLEIGYSPNEGATLTYFENIKQLLEYIISLLY